MPILYVAPPATGHRRHHGPVSVGNRKIHSYTTVKLCYAPAMSELVPHPLPEPLAGLIAERFRVLGDPTRIRLLDALRDGPATVSELQRATGHSQQNVSKHLGLLHGAGLLHREKAGTSTRYSIADQGVFELCEHVCGGLRRHLDQLDSLLQGAHA